MKAEFKTVKLENGIRLKIGSKSAREVLYSSMAEYVRTAGQNKKEVLDAARMASRDVVADVFAQVTEEASTVLRTLHDRGQITGMAFVHGNWQQLEVDLVTNKLLSACKTPQEFAAENGSTKRPAVRKTGIGYGLGAQG